MYVKLTPRLFACCVLLCFVVASHSPTLTRPREIQVQLTQILEQKPARLRKLWTLEHIRATAFELAKAELVLDIPVYKLYGLIELEDGWYFHRCSRNYRSYPGPRGRTIRKRVSEDCGLTQQNTSGTWRGYARGLVAPRCWRVLRRACRRWELFLPALSVKLMVERFRECREFKGDMQFLCYNSTVAARRGKGRYLTVWRKHARRYVSYQ